MFKRKFLLQVNCKFQCIMEQEDGRRKGKVMFFISRYMKEIGEEEMQKNEWGSLEDFEKYMWVLVSI